MQASELQKKIENAGGEKLKKHKQKVLQIQSVSTLQFTLILQIMDDANNP